MATKAKKTASGKWHLQVSYTDASGKKRYKSFTGDTKRDVENRAKLFELDSKERLRKTPGEMTVGECIDAYIESKRHVLSPTTLRAYEVMRNTAFQDIMIVRLKAVTDELLNEAIREEMNRPVDTRQKNGKPVQPKTRSAKSVCNSYGLLSSALKQQMKGVSFSVDLPKKTRRIRDDLPSPAEVYNCVKGTDLELPCLLAMWLSFTMSEIRGLTKSRSINGDYITIREVLVYANGQDIRKELAKTDTRIRRHEMPPYIKELIDQVDGDIIVPLHSNYILKKLKRLLKANGVQEITFHDLRHISATVMAGLRIPDNYAQARGGWKTDHVMKSVYTETFSEGRIEADSKINEYFDNVVLRGSGCKEDANSPESQ